MLRGEMSDLCTSKVDTWKLDKKRNWEKKEDIKIGVRGIGV